MSTDADPGRQGRPEVEHAANATVLPAFGEILSLDAAASAAASAFPPLLSDLPLLARRQDELLYEARASRMSFFRDAVRLRSSVLPRILPSLLGVSLFAAAVATAEVVYGFKWSVPNSVSAPMTLVVGLLLVFRNSSSYERWWSGITVWQRATSDVRSLVRFLWINIDVHASLPPDLSQASSAQPHASAPPTQPVSSAKDHAGTSRPDAGPASTVPDGLPSAGKGPSFYEGDKHAPVDDDNKAGGARDAVPAAAVNPTGSGRISPQQLLLRRRLSAKRRAVRMLVGWLVAVKHHVREEHGVHYRDLRGVVPDAVLRRHAELMGVEWPRDHDHRAGHADSHGAHHAGEQSITRRANGVSHAGSSHAKQTSSATTLGREKMAAVANAAEADNHADPQDLEAGATSSRPARSHGRLWGRRDEAPGSPLRASSTVATPADHDETTALLAHDAATAGSTDSHLARGTLRRGPHEAPVAPSARHSMALTVDTATTTDGGTSSRAPSVAGVSDLLAGAGGHVVGLLNSDAGALTQANANARNAAITATTAGASARGVSTTTSHTSTASSTTTAAPASYGTLHATRSTLGATQQAATSSHLGPAHRRHHEHHHHHHHHQPRDEAERRAQRLARARELDRIEASLESGVRSAVPLPVVLLVEVASYVASARRAGMLDDAGPAGFTMANTLLNSLTTHFSDVERLAYTTLPPKLAIHLKQVVLLYLLLLPLVFTPELRWGVVVLVSAVGFALLGLEGLASEIESPFGWDDSDHALDVLVAAVRHEVEHLLALTERDERQGHDDDGKP